MKSYPHITENLKRVRAAIPEHVTLVAVSKTHPPEAIQSAYDAGQRIFGENKVQELVGKYEVLPRDIEWHLIGHLQTNKVKYIADFVSFIHAVDSEKLLAEIDKRAAKLGRVIDVLLQVHIAEEDSKFGFSDDELAEFVSGTGIAGYRHVRIRGLMGMATFTDDRDQVRREFKHLKRLFDQMKTTSFAGSDRFDTLSMGMSGDFDIAVEEGSTMVRIGSTIFGARTYTSHP